MTQVLLSESMQIPPLPGRAASPRMERLSFRLGARPPRADGGDTWPHAELAAIAARLAPHLAGAAPAEWAPWLGQALTLGGTHWHSVETVTGPVWLIATVLHDGAEEGHALLTIDPAHGGPAMASHLAAARLDAMIRTAGTLCHTVNNALTALLGNAEMLAETENLPEDALASARLVLRAGERLDDLTRRTLRLGRARHPAPGRCDPAARLADLVARLHGDKPPGRQVQLSAQQELGVLLVDPAAFESAVEHLLRNAMSAAGPAGQVRLRAEREDESAWPDFAWLRLTVEDDGPGLPAAELDVLGGGFLGPSKSGGVHPLGLASVRAFTTALGGTLQGAARPGGGTIITLRLPVLTASQVDRPGRMRD